MAVLPENFSFMGLHDVDKRAIAEVDGDGPVQQFLSQQARELGLWIVGGSTPLVLEPGGRVAAPAWCTPMMADAWRATTRCTCSMSIFRARRELPRVEEHRSRFARSRWCRPPAGLLGLSVCYDIRFPELYRADVGGRGAMVATMPSAFTVRRGVRTGRAARARAIENLSYVVAAAQWGRHASGRESLRRQ